MYVSTASRSGTAVAAIWQTADRARRALRPRPARARDPARADRRGRRRRRPPARDRPLRPAGHRAADLRRARGSGDRIDRERTAGAERDAADARNLFRVHWYNDLAGGRVDVPEHVVLPSTLTGVESPIIVVFGDRFPMIGAHKVLAAYACLAPRVITGQFDPTRHRAIWPSTGNYARGGVAISRIMGCRGVAVLPAGMSQERFDWLDRGSPIRPTSSGRRAPRAT